MYYNLSEEQKIFLHISYSMLEEGYDVDQIMEFWNLKDESKIREICESITLSETIDTSNPDFLFLCEKGGILAFLAKLFGRGGKARLRKPPLVTKGGRPITSSGGRGVNPTKPPTGSGASSLPQKVKDKISGLSPKTKAGAATALGTGLIVGTGALLQQTGNLPGMPVNDEEKPGEDKPTTTLTPEQEAERKAEEEAAAEKARREAEAKAEAEKNKRSSGFQRLQTIQPDLYKNSPGFRVSRRAYRNIRANPVPSMYDHYEVIADYLIKEGHASDIEEADYVMRQLDEEFIQSIVESSCGSHKKKKRKK